MTQRELRQLSVVVGAVVFVDTMFYAAVAPLLPQLVRELHLSKLSAGVLTAGYPIGTLLGSIPGGVLAERVGPRETIYAGLALLAASSLAFGLVHAVVLLDAARVAQGVGGAFTWSGGLMWLIVEVPAERRGAAIGSALGAAIGGSLFGPVIGTLAHALGRPAVFSAVVVIAAALGAWVSRLPGPQARERGSGLLNLPAALRTPVVLVGMWLVAMPAIASGAVQVLGPLRLGRFGASATGIGAAFLVAAAAEAVVSPMMGRLSDRRGRMLPMRIGLPSAAVVLACFTLPRTAVLLALVIVLSAVTLGTFWAPAMAMLSDAAEDQGLGQGYALALVNLAWAGGQIVGAGGGGALAKATGDGVPIALTVAMCAGTLALLIAYPLSEKLVHSRVGG
jgi:MFS family permease